MNKYLITENIDLQNKQLRCEWLDRWNYIIISSYSFIKQQTERCCADRNERRENNIQEL